MTNTNKERKQHLIAFLSYGAGGIVAGTRSPGMVTVTAQGSDWGRLEVEGTGGALAGAGRLLFLPLAGSHAALAPTQTGFVCSRHGSPSLTMPKCDFRYHDAGLL